MSSTDSTNHAQFDHQKFKKILDSARKKLHLSLEQLAVYAGISTATLRNYRSGLYAPGVREIYALAGTLKISPSALLPSGQNHDAPQPEIRARLPLYHDIPAGPPIGEPEVAETYEVLAHLAQVDRYVLRVTGTSMVPTIHAGDLIVMEYFSGEDMESVANRICAVLIDGESTLKRVQFQRTSSGDTVVILKGDRADYPDEVFQLGQRDFEIQGVAVAIVERKL